MHSVKLLPTFFTEDKNLQLIQDKWSSVLNPALKSPILNGVQLSDISVTSGDNVINTKLGREYQGYIITGMRGGFVQIYEKPSSLPAVNLTLNASGSAIIDLYVF